MPALLDDAAIDTALKDLPGWRREGDGLVLDAELPTFPVAIGVVARVGVAVRIQDVEAGPTQQHERPVADDHHE